MLLSVLGRTELRMHADFSTLTGFHSENMTPFFGPKILVFDKPITVIGSFSATVALIGRKELSD